MSEEMENTVIDDGMDGDRMVLCGANAYDKKYYCYYCIKYFHFSLQFAIKMLL